MPRHENIHVATQHCPYRAHELPVFRGEWGEDSTICIIAVLLKAPVVSEKHFDR